MSPTHDDYRSGPEDTGIPFTHGLVLLRQGRTNDTLARFTAARELDSGNRRIRKQVWAIEHPEKFYGANGIDWNWQKEQISHEKKCPAPRAPPIIKR